MNYVLALHNILRWAILIFGLWTLINAINGIVNKKIFTAKDNKINLLFLIFCDLQLLVGLMLYFNNTWFDQLKNNTSEVMKNATIRFFAMEHSLMMVIAWLLIHIGRSIVKKSETDTLKHKRSLIYFGIAILIIIAMVPWPFKPAGIARQLLPQF